MREWGKTHAYIGNVPVFMADVSVFCDFVKLEELEDNNNIKYWKAVILMKKAMENFMNTYGKYMAVSAFALKPCSNKELEYMVNMLRNDSQK